MAVNPGGMCWVMTMPGIFWGNCFKTSSIASVPPVDAPMAMTVPLSDSGLNCDITLPDIRRLEVAGAVWDGGMRILDWEATISLEISMDRNASLLIWLFMSGFRTKSTAPAARASNTFMLREDTSMTGSGCLGSSSFKKSRPDIPGISISKVRTSGLRTGIFLLASKASVAYPMISRCSSFESWVISQFLYTAESSMIISRILRSISFPSFW